MDPAILSMMSPEEINALWELPAMDPPNSVIPDLANPGGNDQVAVAVATLCGVIAGLAFLLRFASRVVTKKVYIEDGGLDGLAQEKHAD